MERTPFAFALVALLIGGCLGGAGPDPADPLGLLSLSEIEARLSKPEYDSILREEAYVEGANGTQLWLDIYRPEDAREPVPVILQMTPYGFFVDTRGSCDEVPRGKCPPDPGLVDFFVPRGYAVAFADVRGHRNSGGCSDRAGIETWQDGYNVVEWLATQSWANGRVGMHGGSYDADVQIGTAILQPPHLATIVPVAATSNLYGANYYDGVAYGSAAGPAAAEAALGVWPGPGFQPTGYVERFSCQPQHILTAADTSGDWSTFWGAHDFRPFAANIAAAVLQVHGLQDPTVRPDHLDGFWNNLTAEKRLILGQWGHGFPDRPDWPQIRHRWFDHYLRGTDTGILQDLPPVLVEDDTGAWRGIESFPVTNATTMILYLSVDGTATEEPPAEGSLTMQDYPRGGFIGVGSQVLSLPGETATRNPRQLVFETEPLEEDLHYTGRPLLYLVAETNAKSTHWVVRLVEATPDEQGQPELSDSSVINRGFLNARHRLGVSNPQDVTPGEAYMGNVVLYPQDDIIEKGNRLRVVLDNNDNWVMQDTTFATSEVHLGPAGTYLMIPLAPAGVPVPEHALRAELAPQA